MAKKAGSSRRGASKAAGRKSSAKRSGGAGKSKSSAARTMKKSARRSSAKSPKRSTMKSSGSSGKKTTSRRRVAAVRRAESRENVESVLLAASQTFPELQDYQAAHLERIVETWARILQRLGSRWSRPRLTRLLRYLYLLNAASVTYQRQFQPSERERREWDNTIMLAGIALCMPH